MTEFEIRLTAEARQNIDAIYAWIADRSSSGAANWYRNLLAAFDSLQRDPLRSALAPEAHHFSVSLRNKSFRMKSGRVYRILYSIDGSKVQILYVRGPGQNWVSP
jgi:plasmid stabilization system protein ParE